MLAPYQADLARIAAALARTVWLTGGCVRNSLMAKEYASDIDCVVHGTSNQVIAALRRGGFTIASAPLGCPRVYTADGNHVDLIIAEGDNEEDAIEDTLSQFQFSVNAVAIDLASGRSIATVEAQRDIELGCFRINPNWNGRTGLKVLARDFEILSKFEGIKPNDDPATSSVARNVVDLQIAAAKESSRTAMRLRARLAQEFTPPGAEIWLVRGAVRTSRLSDLRYWDDTDVVVACPTSVIFAHLEKSGIAYTKNFYGSPKITAPDGAKIDIWGLQRGSSIETEPNRYVHNLDRLVWSARQDDWSDPCHCAADIKRRWLNVSARALANVSEHDLRYAACKSAYLILRHNLDWSSAVDQLLRRPFSNPSHFLSKQVLRLARELFLCLDKQELASRLAHAERRCPGSVPIALLRRFSAL